MFLHKQNMSGSVNSRTLIFLLICLAIVSVVVYFYCYGFEWQFLVVPSLTRTQDTVVLPPLPPLPPLPTGRTTQVPSTTTSTSAVMATTPSTGGQGICGSMSRTNRLARSCDHLKDADGLSPGQTYAHLVVDDQHKLIYCPIPKAACTTTKVMLAIASGSVNSTDIQGNPGPYDIHNTLLQNCGIRSMGSMESKEIKRLFQEYFAFLIVRHPIERLYSAWSNKFKYENLFPKMYSKVILKNFPNVAKREGGILDLSFEQFLRLIVIEELDVHEPHFEKQVRLCNPCQLEYDYIGKVETFEADARNVLLPRLNLTEVPRNINKRGKVRRGKELFYLPAIAYAEAIRDIPSALLNRVKEKYREDFELFGYSIESNISECDIIEGNGVCC